MTRAVYMTRLATFWFIIGITVMVVIWDIVVALAPPAGDTISKVLRQIMMDYTSVAFGIGVLGGHVTSDWRWIFPTWWYWVSLPLLVLTVGALIAADVIQLKMPIQHVPFLYVAFGVVWGHVLWPQ